MAPTHGENLARIMPDVANEARPALAGRLEWVGMGQIEIPVSLADDAGHVVHSGARVDAFVNLVRPDMRGIHMSRLYLHVDRALGAEPLSPSSLRRLLKDFLDSHAGLSDRAMVQLRFDYLVRRPALVSDNTGWKAYPVSIRAELARGQFSLELGVELAYSSTCPCSAALARQLVQENFTERFADGEPLDRDAVLRWLGSEEGIDATPHSQRSRAEVRAKLAPSFKNLPVLEIVDRIEAALQTPVQTAVKREDEQAFARLNGRNLMFCEDAARRMQAALDADERIDDFWLRASHFESLHPHDAVAVATKGVPGGYGPLG
jgi:GTP cyclohydrolase I